MLTVSDYILEFDMDDISDAAKKTVNKVGGFFRNLSDKDKDDRKPTSSLGIRAELRHPIDKEHVSYKIRRVVSQDTYPKNKLTTLGHRG